MKQKLLNELNAIEGDIVFINCTNMGSVPHIVRGPRFNVPLLKRQVASLITMGFKIEILSHKKEVIVTQETKEVLVEDAKLTEILQDVSVVKLDGSRESFTYTLESTSEIVEDSPNENIEEKKEDEIVEDVSVDNNLEGMSKTKLKKLLKEHNIEFENSDSIEVLKEKASAII